MLGAVLVMVVKFIVFKKRLLKYSEAQYRHPSHCCAKRIEWTAALFDAQEPNPLKES
jgi:hypothetical protein